MARILVIDDDRIQRAVASHALIPAGHQVLEASDGQEGLESARLHQPDLIVCDVVMPQMDGFQFLEVLRQEPGISATPVIMLTSMSDRAHMREGMNAGADDYLAKPFSVDELVDAVTALLGKRRSLQEGLINSMNTSFVTALEEQRDVLAAQYEQRLLREIGGRWERDGQGDFELKYEHAAVLKADIVGALTRQATSSAEASALVRRAYDAALDSLHLFNAAHLLPAGNDIVAIYEDKPESVAVRAAVRAVRASLALVKATAHLRAEGARRGAAHESPPTANVALHSGPVAVLHMSDPLHGGGGSTVAVGETMRELGAICDFARAAGWAIAASPTFVGEMGGQLVTGRSAQIALPGTALPLDVVEVLSLR